MSQDQVRATVPHEGAQELLDDAHALGWSIVGHQAGRRANSYTLISPINQNIKIDVPPVRQWNQDKLRGHVDRLYRYSDPDKVEALQRRKERQEQERQEKLREVQVKGQEALDAAQERATATTAPKSPPKPAPPAGRPSLAYVKEPTVVETKPWVVRHGTRDGMLRVYDSHAVLQRTWSDGKVDFTCVTGDGYSNDEPWRVSTHYARTNDDKHPNRSVLPEYRYVSPQEYTAYTPVLTKHFSSRAAHEELPEEVETPTVDPAEILAKIVALVLPDSGLLDALRDEVAELTELLSTAELERDQAAINQKAAEAERDAAVADRDKLKARLTTLRSSLLGDDD